MDNSFQNLLREQLHQLFPEAKEDGAGANVLINCPLCAMEGRPDHNRHMSICLGTDGRPLYYNCWKDNRHRGVLTSDNLIKLSSGSMVMPDAGFLDLLDEYIRKSGNISKYKLDRTNHYRVSTNYKIDENEITEIKRHYICKRIGIELSVEELVYNKVIFSLKELLFKNYIKRYTRDPRVMDMLDLYFVGFLTNNNGTVILRNMVKGKMELPKSIDERYIKYNIVQGAKSGYYIIPTTCNMHEHIDVHLAEGTFDILSIFYNLREGNRTNNVYGSIGGNSYLSMMEYFLTDIGLVDVDFHIYIDNDIKPHVIPQIEKMIRPLAINTYIHMNTMTGEKDFGVPRVKIQECVYKLI